jgi:hypothetical protein
MRDLEQEGARRQMNRIDIGYRHASPLLAFIPAMIGKMMPRMPTMMIVRKPMRRNMRTTETAM